MITGSKSKKSSNPVDQDATLRTQSTIRQLHLISSGEIKGPPYRNITGTKDQYLSTYFDDTPVRYVNNGVVSNNFGQNIALYYRTGSIDQPTIPGFEEVGQMTSVGATVVFGSDTAVANPVTRTCSAQSVGALVELTFPQGLGQQTNDGARSLAVELDISTKLSSSSIWTSVLRPAFNDLSKSSTSITYRISRPVGVGTWQFRVTRITPDHKDKQTSTVQVEAYTELYEGTTYDGFAIVGVAADATSLSDSKIPTMGFEFDGIILQVPSNYTPGYYDGENNWVNPVYTGTWDGTFKRAWTNNPVWVLYHALTDPYDGEGVPANAIDRYNFYSVAQYCDELVTTNIDGVDVSVPRYRFNWQFIESEPGFKQYQTIASSFNSIIVWSQSGGIALSTDRLKIPKKVIARSDVIDETGIIWRGEDLSNLNTVVNVTWYDPSNSYKADIVTISADEYYGTTSYSDKYGYNTADIVAIGCTDKAQAIRLGRQTLDNTLINKTVVSFEMSHNGYDLNVGDVIIVHDPAVVGTEYSSILVSATATTITLQDPIAVASGTTIRINSPVGIITATATATSSSTIITHGGYTGGVVSDLIPGVTVLATTKYGTFMITDMDKDYEKETIKVVARQYTPSIYSRIDGNLSITLPQDNQSVYFVSIPVELSFEPELINVNNSIKRNLIVRWGLKEQEQAASYVVDWACGSLSGSIDTTTQYATIQDLPMGDVRVSVTAVGLAGNISKAATGTYSFVESETPTSLIYPPINLMSNGVNFVTPDCNITWEYNPQNDNTAIMDYKLEILDGNTVLRTTYIPHIPGTTKYNYLYTYAANIGDGGPRRSFGVRVYSRRPNKNLSSPLT